jgi:hypothetical protein
MLNMKPQPIRIRKRGQIVQQDGIRFEGKELGLTTEGLKICLTHIPSGYRIGSRWDSLGAALAFGQGVAGLIRHGDGGEKGPRWDIDDPELAIQELEKEVKRCYGISSKNGR